MVYLDWKLTLFTFCTFPSGSFLHGFLWQEDSQERPPYPAGNGGYYVDPAGTLAATRVVKSFVREPYEIARFDQQNKANFYANMKVPSSWNPVSCH